MSDKELKEQLKKEMLDLCETNSSVMTYMECLMRKYENLQSKIDKINQYLEEHFIFDDKNGEYYQTHTFDKDNAKELHDILKENK